MAISIPIHRVSQNKKTISCMYLEQVNSNLSQEVFIQNSFMLAVDEDLE
jgi:hypothetical protein